MTLKHPHFDCRTRHYLKGNLQHEVCGTAPHNLFSLPTKAIDMENIASKGHGVGKFEGATYRLPMILAEAHDRAII